MTKITDKEYKEILDKWGSCECECYIFLLPEEYTMKLDFGGPIENNKYNGTFVAEEYMMEKG